MTTTEHVIRPRETERALMLFWNKTENESKEAKSSREESGWVKEWRKFSNRDTFLGSISSDIFVVSDEIGEGEEDIVVCLFGFFCGWLSLSNSQVSWSFSPIRF